MSVARSLLHPLTLNQDLILRMQARPARCESKKESLCRRRSNTYAPQSSQSPPLSSFFDSGRFVCVVGIAMVTTKKGISLLVVVSLLYLYLQLLLFLSNGVAVQVLVATHPGLKKSRFINSATTQSPLLTLSRYTSCSTMNLFFLADDTTSWYMYAQEVWHIGTNIMHRAIIGDRSIILCWIFDALLLCHGVSV